VLCLEQRSPWRFWCKVDLTNGLVALAAWWMLMREAVTEPLVVGLALLAYMAILAWDVDRICKAAMQ
jgi:hypothetical protein